MVFQNASCHPPCFHQTWRTAAVLRGVEAAGMALCYGKNNGGACAAGSVHPLAPNVVQSSPRPFSYPTRLPINPPSPLFLFTPSPSLSPPLKLHFLPTFLSFSSPFPLLSISPTFCACSHASCLFLLQSLLSISSFLLPHKDSHSPMALRGEQNILRKCKSCTEMPSQSRFLP